jgi:hypothetical protein
MEEERKRMEQDREKAREVRRRERERKLAQRDNSSGSGSSESLTKGLDRNRWAWSVEARASESTDHLNGVKPHPQGSESAEDENKSEEAKKSETQEKKEQVPMRKTSQTVKPQTARERKPSSDFFQFGIDYSTPKNSVKHRETSNKSPEAQQTASQLAKSPVKAEPAAAKKTEGTENSVVRSDSPVVIVSPPPTPELKENHETAPVCRWRERSPAAEHKLLKAYRRKTPVISTDALDAILRGEIGDESEALQYATEPNPHHPSQLETFPEEEEPLTSPPRTSSPLAKNNASAPNGHQSLADRREEVLPSALKDPNCSISPEKRRVTLLASNRTQSVDLERMLSPEGSDHSASHTPSPTSEGFSKSFDASRSHGAPKPEGVSRLTVSGSYSSLSRSTPDLSDILGGTGKKKGKERSRKVERSSSRRMGIGYARMDSYVTSTVHSSSYYHSPASPHLLKSGRHATVTSRLLSGGKGFLSKWNESKNARQNHKVSS